MTIEIYDVDTQFLFGVTKLPLDLLLPKGTHHISKAIEIEVCDPDNGLKFGSLQLGLSTLGSFIEVEEQTKKMGRQLQKSLNQKASSFRNL